MKVKAIKIFRDKMEGVIRNPGDTFTVSDERYKELNSTKIGTLVEKVAEETKSIQVKKPKATPKKSAKK